MGIRVPYRTETVQTVPVRYSCTIIVLTENSCAVGLGEMDT